MRYASLFTLFTLTCMAANRIDFVSSGFDETGLVVVPSTSAQFASELRKFPNPVPSQFQPLLQYAIIVRNDSHRTVRAATYRYTVLRADGTGGNRSSIYNSWGDPLSPQDHPFLRPGDRFLLSPVQTFGEALAGATQMVSSRAQQRTLDELSTAVSIRVSLDNVIFEDGEIAGKDEAHVQSMYNDGARARSDLHKELAGISSHSDALAALKRHVHTTREAFYKPDGTLDHYVAELDLAARKLLDTASAAPPVQAHAKMMSQAQAMTVENTPKIWRKQ